MRIRLLFLCFLLTGLLTSLPAQAQEEELDKPLGHPLEKGDQARKDIANGFFLSSEVGLLTYLPGIGDGSQIYRGGMMLSMRFGGSVSRTVSLYGRLGATLLDNTVCARTANISDRECLNFPYPPPRAGRRPLARQGLSILAGIGVRWNFLTLDDRFALSLIGEALFQVIPADNVPEGTLPTEREQLERLHANRLKPAFGGGVGVGLGGEYFFYLKHFSFTVDLTYYFFFTPFMDAKSSSTPLAGMLGHAFLVSVGLKYTF